MEIHSLNLIAFGPFSDRVLEFSSGAGGLHIVYGPNEAGKSSSLRGLKGLLFGIPSKTTDDFLHQKNALRIAGTLQSASGLALTVVRRKGNKNTLSSPDGDPLDESAFTPFLHGVSPEIFERMFGIDHETLVLGGQEILEQKGEIGQALFAASMGSASLHAVLEQLDTDADALFKPRGSTQAINAHLKAFADCQKGIRETSLSSRDWTDKYRALEKTDHALVEIRDQLLQSKAARNRLRRIQKALPKLTAQQRLLDQSALLGTVILLPDDFGKRREDAVLALGSARATADSATTNLAGLQDQLEAIALDTRVLAFGETIKDLHARLGGHRKAMQDRPGLEARRQQLVNDSEALLTAVRPDLSLADAATLRPLMNTGVRISELGSRRESLHQQLIQAKKSVRDAETGLKKTRGLLETLADTPSPEALRKQVALSRKLGDVDNTIETGLEQIESLEQACQTTLSRLGPLWPGSLGDLPGLILPASASIDRIEQDYTALEKRLQRLEERQAEYTNTASDAKKQLTEILNAGSVPTETDLEEVREGRDQVWSLLRQQWLEGRDVQNEASALDPERPLPDVFESRVTDADELADRLRREAERVQKRAALLAIQADAEDRLQQIVAETESCHKEKLHIDDEWTRSWDIAHIQPLPPREMRAWLGAMEKLQARTDELNEQRRRSDQLLSIRRTHIQALQQALRGVGEVASDSESLEVTLLDSEAVAERLVGLANQRSALTDDIDKLATALDAAQVLQGDAEETLDDWKQQWQALVADLGLNADALPAEAVEILQNITSLFAKLKEAEELQFRIEGIDRDADQFTTEVTAAVDSIAPELTELSAEESVIRLNKLLNDMLTVEAGRNQLEAQLQKAQESIDQAQSACKTMTERLNALCQEAHCTEVTELEAAERASSSARALAQNIHALERELLDIGEGLSLEALKTEAEGADPDALPGEIEALTSQIESELEPRQTQLAIAKGEQQHALGLMDGSDAAAALADTAQSILVEIQSNAEQYVRLKLAARILRDEIERYRQQHQGPLLARASDHFTELTQGSFAGLRADFNAKDEPVLVGVRPDDTPVTVDGMSSGTRDQLYLALRLASLEKYIETAEPMPFIVDDILVHFDDDRSQATLSVLAELAKKTQVILFTHHRRLVEQARALKVTAPVVVHEL